MYYDTTEKRPIRSRPQEVINSSTDYASLFVLSPDHGKVNYTWEKKGDWAWEMIDIPPNTCIVYVNSSRRYRCSVGDDHYYFDVHVSGRVVFRFGWHLFQQLLLL